MPYREFANQNCSIAAAMAVLGGRWTLLVMREILLGRRRFAEIQRNVGLAPNILSDRLHVLVEHGLVARRRYCEHPESYEYVPTVKGLDVSPVLVAVLQWGDRHAGTPAGPPRVFVHTVCGHDAEPELHCGHCGRPITPDELQVRPGPGADARQRAEPLLPAA
ncbi:MAG: helix-turn-helix transcriptional regulator [Actinobacteria bacterium]|nr:helix-turn-helix transcriptional regulator [Actinomycetota bacterium]